MTRVRTVIFNVAVLLLWASHASAWSWDPRTWQLPWSTHRTTNERPENSSHQSDAASSSTHSDALDATAPSTPIQAHQTEAGWSDTIQSYWNSTKETCTHAKNKATGTWTWLKDSTQKGALNARWSYIKDTVSRSPIGSAWNMIKEHPKTARAIAGASVTAAAACKRFGYQTLKKHRWKSSALISSVAGLCAYAPTLFQKSTSQYEQWRQDLRIEQAKKLKHAIDSGDAPNATELIEQHNYLVDIPLTEDGIKPLHYIAMQKSSTVAHLFIAETLTKYGVRLSDTHNDKNAIDLAVAANNKPFVDYILKKANLQEAIDKGNLLEFSKLINNDKDLVDTTFENGMTPLHYIAQKDDTVVTRAMARVCIKHSANVLALYQGKTPAELAYEHGNKDLGQQLHIAQIGQKVALTK